MSRADPKGWVQGALQLIAAAEEAKDSETAPTKRTVLPPQELD